jgi:predicted amidohydrolase YtcJ
MLRTKKRSRDRSWQANVGGYVVLAEEPHTVAPGRIKDIKLVRTATAGKTVYQA